MTSFLHTSDHHHPETHLQQRQSHFCPGPQSFINYADFPAFGLLPLPDLDIAPPYDDPMHPDSWGGPAAGPPFTSKLGRFSSHHRESSFSSSLGSSGPVSPFQQHLPTPQISISDASEDAMMDMDMQSHADINMSHSGGAPFYHHQFAKPFESYQPFLHHHPNHLDNAAAVTELAYPVTIPGPPPKHQRPRVDRSLLPAPDFVVSGSSRSHNTSVASSIAGDSPATPTVGETDSMMEGRRQGSYNHPSSSATATATATASDTEDLSFWLAGHNAPKLDRTMTDVYGDELYSPNFTITSSSPSQAPANVAAALPSTTTSTTTAPNNNNNNVFNQRLSAANSQHLSTTSHQSPSSSTLSRDMTPFRSGTGNSPLVQQPVALQDWMHKANVGAFNSARGIREQNKAQQDAQLVHQQEHKGKVDSRTPQTISPKDAMLEFNEADEEAQFPLFPQSAADWTIEQLTGAISGVNAFGSNPQAQAQAQLNYAHSQGPSTVQVPQQYPFVSQQRTIQQTPVQRTGSGESNSTRASDQSLAQPGGGGGRPVNATGTDGGTYTCTYHGCTLRFETPSLLQRHKREGHRQTHTLGGALRHQDASTASGLLNSQAGPHQCTRINPSTGKPCMTIFSRPYDLTRHEDTIHNARKQKVHCGICTEDKTFSRADALTRHYRVCHPDMELPGKHRRRGGS